MEVRTPPGKKPVEDIIGSQGLLIALAIGLIMFGAKRLPELARGLGESVKEFKKGIAHDPDPDPAPSPTPPPAALVSAAAPSRQCGTCHVALQTDWTHCPKCGAATAPVG